MPAACLRRACNAAAPQPCSALHAHARSRAGPGDHSPPQHRSARCRWRGSHLVQALSFRVNTQIKPKKKKKEKRPHGAAHRQLRRQVAQEPGVPPDVLHGRAPVRVGLEDAADQVAAVRAHQHLRRERVRRADGPLRARAPAGRSARSAGRALQGGTLERSGKAACALRGPVICAGIRARRPEGALMTRKADRGAHQPCLLRTAGRAQAPARHSCCT